MKLFVNRAVVDAPWGGGNNFVRALHEHGPKHGLHLVSSLDAFPDVVLLIGPDPDALGVSAEHALRYRDSHPGTRLVFRLNDCDARKGTTGVDERLWRIAARADALVFVSEWLMAHLIESWSSIPKERRHTYVNCARSGDMQRSTVIINGVDRKLFAPRPKTERRWLKVVTHHWSDNRLKGADVYEAIERLPGVGFTYIGRHKCNFVRDRTCVVGPLQGLELAQELADHDVYVTGTHADPGPNHVIEAISSGLPVIASADGGGAVEFAGATHTFSNQVELAKLIDRCRRKELGPNALIPDSWDECVWAYARFMQGEKS